VDGKIFNKRRKNTQRIKERIANCNGRKKQVEN